MNNLVITLSVALSLSASLMAKAEEVFPGRTQFPELQVYSKTQLAEDFTRALIIDARSEKEFDQLHIRGAINIPIDNSQFVKRVNALRKQSTRRIVFYSNGFKCHKAYKATRTAMQADVKNVFVYDAGVLEWKKDYPLRVTLAKEKSSRLYTPQLAQLP